MIRFLASRLAGLEQVYPEPAKLRRARSINLVVVTGFLVWLAWMLVVEVPAQMRGEGAFLPAREIGTPLLALIAIWLVYSGRLRIASWILVISVLIPAVVVLNAGGLDNPTFVLIALPVVTAALLLTRNGFLFILMLVLASVTIMVSGQFGTSQSLGESGIVGGVFGLMLLASLLLLFGDATEAPGSNRNQMRQILRLGELRSSPEEENDVPLLVKAIEILRDNVRFNFVQIFLVDQEGRPFQRIRSGFQTTEVTELTLADSSAIYQAAKARSIVEVFAHDAPQQREHMMPFSAFGLAVPVYDDDVPVAVIDVQSNQQPFTELDRVMVTTLANSLGPVLHDARLIRSLRTELSQQEAALDGLRSRLRETRSPLDSPVTNLWNPSPLQQSLNSIGFDLQGDGRLISRDDLPGSLRDAILRGELVTEIRNGSREVIAPIILHNQVLGAMAFSLPAEQPFSERQAEMVQNALQRLAVALENNYLMEQSRLQAYREHTANEIGNALLSAADLDQLLDIAADMFKDVLEAVHTHIHINPDLVDPSSGTDPVTERTTSRSYQEGQA